MADNNDENTYSNKEPEESSAGQEKPTLVFSADKKKASPLFKIKCKLNDVRQYIAENPEAVLEKVLVVVGLVGSIVAAREAITRGVSIIDGDSKSKYPICNMCGSEMTDFDGVDWYTCPECGNMIKDYGDGEWIWVNDLLIRAIQTPEIARIVNARFLAESTLLLMKMGAMSMAMYFAPTAIVQTISITIDRYE